MTRESAAIRMARVSGEGKVMDWTAIAATKVDDLTRTRSTGRPVNTHVVPSRISDQPDFDRMQKLVHPRGRKEAAPPRRADDK